jgi:hypothetical protein
MTALEIIKHLQNNRRDVLWLNDDRREAALRLISQSRCIPVDFSEARVARTDTGLQIVEECDGEIVAAR